MRFKSSAILFLAKERIFSTSFFCPHDMKILSPILESVNSKIFSQASEEKNFPTGPLPTILLFSSIKVKYAKPPEPSFLAQLSILSKKLLGLSFVFFVMIAFTILPFETSLLKISNLTSSLLKISDIFEFTSGFLRSGLSVTYF